MQNIHFDEETEVALREECAFDMRALYKTVWEIKQKHLVEMAADRGAFIDQSQSFNVHIGDPNFGKLTSLHFTAWRAGLKTGMYYLRTRAAADAIKFTVRHPYHPCRHFLCMRRGDGEVASGARGVQVDQEALANATKGKLALGAGEVGKENGSPRAGKAKLALRRSSSSLRPALSVTTNQLAAAGAAAAAGSPKAPADVDMAQEAKMAAMVCSLENKDACLSCGS